MKNAYELAMERLNRDTPLTKSTPEQIARVNEIDEIYRAKIAEREVFLQSKISTAQLSGRFEEAAELKQELARDVAVLREEAETKKEKARRVA
jgi:uncharacterized protein YydD (DUF2326 family)